MAKEPAVAAHVVCLVGDFFFPRFGGVETHMYSLAHCLLRLGVKVIVVTHQSDGMLGLHELDGLRVYYLPLATMGLGVIYPTLGLATLPHLARIYAQEAVNLVHGHQSTSVMCMEGILVARTMGIRCVFTEHSLFGFSDVASILVNKFLRFYVSDVHHCIAVSRACRTNLSKRAHVPLDRISVIPNAIDAIPLVPRPSLRPKDRVVVLLLSRLVHRKGLALAMDVIPSVCARHPNIHFRIGGEGPFRRKLEAMREANGLQDRLELVGRVSGKDVPDFLARGHIFLNCSLTESFCIAILEAASCGLFVVSTNVGGLPEVLPHDMVAFSPPDAVRLAQTLCSSLDRARAVDPWEYHQRVSGMYTWPATARETKKVYDAVRRRPVRNRREQFRRYCGTGPCLGVLAFLTMGLLLLWWSLLHAIGLIQATAPRPKPSSVYVSSSQSPTPTVHKEGRPLSRSHESRERPVRAGSGEPLPVPVPPPPPNRL